MYCLWTFCRRTPGKKLKRAARYLINQGSGADEIEADAKVFGAILPDVVKDVCFYVLPENWDTVRAFMAVQTQWRYAPSGDLTGLDYAGVRVAVSALGLRFKEVFEGLQVMEWEALSARTRDSTGDP